MRGPGLKLLFGDQTTNFKLDMMSCKRNGLEDNTQPIPSLNISGFHALSIDSNQAGSRKDTVCIYFGILQYYPISDLFTTTTYLVLIGYIKYYLHLLLIVQYLKRPN